MILNNYIIFMLLYYKSGAAATISIIYKQLLYEQNEKKLQMRMRMSGELTSCHRQGLVVEARFNASYEESRSMS